MNDWPSHRRFSPRILAERGFRVIVGDSPMEIANGDPFVEEFFVGVLIGEFLMKFLVKIPADLAHSGKVSNPEAMEVSLKIG